MVRKGIIERRNEEAKKKPRGKPFPKGHKKGSHDIADKSSSGLEISDEGGVIDPSPQEVKAEDLNRHENVLSQIPKLVMETIDHNLKEAMNTPQQIKEETLKDLELVESVDFMNGPNKLSLRFSKKHNRMYRIQIFLNDEHEVRPVTYSGASTGTTFWNLLKGVFKK